jgi:hypothetical protein
MLFLNAVLLKIVAHPLRTAVFICLLECLKIIHCVRTYLSIFGKIATTLKLVANEIFGWN